MAKMSPQQLAKLQSFEDTLNPARPEGGVAGARIIGYGEMSTVFTFTDSDLAGVAFKRMALFHSYAEVEKYKKDYLEYNQILTDLGLNIPDSGSQEVAGRDGRVVLYLSQRMLDSDSIANKLIHRQNKEQACLLFQAILAHLEVVFRLNRDGKHRAQKDEDLAIGFDAQISNWAVSDFPSDGSLPTLFYIDTSTPLIRKGGEEQLNSELFLRICPSAMVWIIRRFFLADVLERYYDLRLVILDIIANLYKEKKEDLIPEFMEIANDFLRAQDSKITPLSEDEVKKYYKEDALIWRLFSGLRRMERSWRTLRGKPYDLILPGKISR